MARVLQDENLLIQISHGHVASNKMYYDKSSIKCCYHKHRRRYIKCCYHKHGRRYIKKLKVKDEDDEKTSVKR